MGVLVVAIGLGCLVGTGCAFFLDPIEAIFPALGVFALSYFLLARRISRQLQAGMEVVQKEMMKGQNHIDRALQLLEALKTKFGRLQFFASSSIDAQIGTIHFMRKDFQKARPYLEKSFVRVWHARTMLAVLHSKKKDFEAVDKVMEQAAKYSGKQGLMWSVWAYLHWKAGNNDKAIQILLRGKEALKDGDPHLSANLLALQNGKKIKMKPYGDQWYQFHLEQHPQMRQAARGGNVRFARR
jgi:hypothetical protein